MRRLILIILGCIIGAGCGASKQLHYRIEPRYAVGQSQFRHVMGNLLGPPIVEGNQVVELINGEEIFPAMLAAIRSAQKTVTFETFVYWRGKVGEAFTDALCERAAAGVNVHIILDALGSGRIDRSYVKRMREAGVQVERYHPLRWFDIASTQRVNNRTHRKILVVDGKVGFTGGVGIADEWLGDAESPRQWRDNHYRIEGPAVAQLQAAFTDNWIESHGTVLHGEEYFPPLAPAGTLPAQVFQSSAQGGSQSMQLLYLLSLAAAQKHVRLCTPYFVPDRQTINAMTEAQKRGVQLQVIVPGPRIDLDIVRRASRATWGKLLESGVEIYEYQPTMYHCKVMIVDDQWVSIGSANLDNRSFKLNDEANVNVLDVQFARRQAEIFEQDRARSVRITLEQWRRRPIWEKIGEAFASLLGSQL